MPQVITTILLDDNPKGLRLVTIENRSIKAFVVPRGKLKELRSRDDAQQPGLYFLFGEGEQRSTAYIGQSENVLNRLLRHDHHRPEDEWNTALVFVGHLDSTFARYLESISINLAQKSNRYEIFNGNLPQENTVSEAQKIVALEYFELIKTIVGLLGYALFENPDEQKEKKAVYQFATDKANAKGTLLESGEFIVFAGSLFRQKETAAFSGRFSSVLRLKLRHLGVLKEKDKESYELMEDYVFPSPSAAAASVAGRSVNGWTAWKDQDGKTLDENVRQ